MLNVLKLESELAGAFFFPLRDLFMNWIDILLVLGSFALMIFKKMSDVSAEAPFPPGAEWPVISCNAQPELCEGYCDSRSSNTDTSVARKGMTAARVFARIRMAIRLLRAAAKVAELVKMSLGYSSILEMFPPFLHDARSFTHFNACTYLSGVEACHTPLGVCVISIS
jgi:hypothetical protein